MVPMWMMSHFFGSKSPIVKRQKCKSAASNGAKGKSPMSIDAAIAFMVGQAMVEPEPTLKVVRNQPIVKQVKAKKEQSKFTGEQPAPQSDTPKMQAMLLPTPEVAPQKNEGATDEQITAFRKAQATEFMLSFRRATDRNGQIVSIARFIGYDQNADYGSQELAARSRATLYLKPIAHKVPLPAYTRTVQPSVAGYIAGMPSSPIAKEIKDLEGRIVFALDKAREEESLAEGATTTKDKLFHKSLAQAERERIEHIRKDLKSLLG